MTEYDFCRKCRCQRFVIGFSNADYFEMGWVKEIFQRFDKPTCDAFFTRIEWLCPDCRQAELAEEKRKDEEHKELIRASMRNDPKLYERIMRERAS